MALIIKGGNPAANKDVNFAHVILLKEEETGNSRLNVCTEYIRKGSKVSIENSNSEISCIQILSGEGYCENHYVCKTHFLFVSHNFKTVFTANEDTVILKTVVKDFKRYEQLGNEPARGIRLIDWHDEPVLQSEHDARQRVYIATKNLLGTYAIKGEIIIYPPRTKAPLHYHVGAEHFQYILSGECLATLDGKHLTLKAGDLVYNFENEIHSFENISQEPFTFVEFFVPGDCETIWTTTRNVCTWSPTNKNLNGSDPKRYIPKHVHGEKIDI
jgi:quercetin dioxygenase-like cupin family protein